MTWISFLINKIKADFKAIASFFNLDRLRGFGVLGFWGFGVLEIGRAHV